MKIAYVSLSYVPSRRASSVHVMKLGQALTRAGSQVTLITKKSLLREEAGVADDFAFYGIELRFEIVKLPRPAVRGGGLVFQAAVTRFLKRHRGEIDLVYAREAGGAIAATRLDLPLIFEAHAPPTGREVPRFRRIVRHSGLIRIVVISAALRDRLLTDGLIPKNIQVLVAPDAADPLGAMCEAAPIGSGRARYGYIGQLYPGKAMELLVPLAEIMLDAEFDVVGGSRKDLRRLRRVELPPNLKFHGFVPHGGLASLYRRFDAVLLPSQREVYGASGRSAIGEFMSPMKLFEYMAAGKPIVSSDLPVLREVLRHRENALLVPPDDARAWKEALEKLASEPDLARRLAETACRDFLNHYTWDARAASVLEGL